IDGKVHVMPFLMVPGFQQRWKTGEECLDEVHYIAVPLGNETELRSREHGADRNRFDRLVRGHQFRVVRRREPGRHIDLVRRIIKRDVDQMQVWLLDALDERYRLAS